MDLFGKKYSNSFFFSIGLHLVVLALLIFSFSFSSKMAVVENSDKNTQVMNAMVMNTPLPPVKSVKPAKPIPQPKLAKPEKPILPPKPEPAVVQQPKKNAIAILDKKQKKLQQEKIEKQLLADIEKQTEKQKKLKQKAVADAFAKELKQLSAKSIQQQMQQEQQRIAGARTQQVQGEVNKYKALILQAISQNWLVPGTVNKHLYAELLIRVAPGGLVLDVQIVKGSGDVNLDRSARAAVFKSSPLPVPRDSAAFDPFRQFVLKVKPENIMSDDSWQS